MVATFTWYAQVTLGRAMDEWVERVEDDLLEILREIGEIGEPHDSEGRQP